MKLKICLKNREFLLISFINYIWKNDIKLLDKETTKSELRDLNNQLNTNLEKAKNEIMT